MNLLQQWRSRWRGMPAREQRLALMGLAVFSLALLWWLALAPALALLRAAPAQHRMLDGQLQQMLQLQAQAKALQAQPVLSLDATRLALEAALKPLGPGAQMTVQFDRVTVTLKAVDATALAQWLATVRQNAHVAPAEARLVRNPAGSWDGSLVLSLGGRQ